MKIQKFEKYNMDIDNGQIAEEYAKKIISKFIDSQIWQDKHETMEKIYKDIIKSDNLDENQAIFIKNEILGYIKHLYEEAKKIREIYQIDANDYNL